SGLFSCCLCSRGGGLPYILLLYERVLLLQSHCCEHPPIFPVTTLTGCRASLDTPRLVPHRQFFALRYPACWASASLVNVMRFAALRICCTNGREKEVVP